MYRAGWHKRSQKSPLSVLRGEGVKTKNNVFEMLWNTMGVEDPFMFGLPARAPCQSAVFTSLPNARTASGRKIPAQIKEWPPHPPSPIG